MRSFVATCLRSDARREREGGRESYTVKLSFIYRCGSLNKSHLELEATRSAQEPQAEADHQCVGSSHNHRDQQHRAHCSTQGRKKTERERERERRGREVSERETEWGTDCSTLFNLYSALRDNYQKKKKRRIWSGRKVLVKMPRVVPDQRSKFENEEFFRKLSRECEVSLLRFYTRRK